MAERRRAEANPRLDRVRDAEPAENGLERCAPLLDRRRDQRDLLGRRAAADQRDQLLADELERPAGTGAFEEAERGIEVGRRRRRLLEEGALEVREGRMRVLGRPGRQLLDATVRERRQVVGRALERREGDAARLVGQRHVHLGAARERLEQRPLGAGEVLEAVGEDGLAVPRIEIGLEPLRSPAAQQVAIPEPEPVELRPVGGVQLREVAGELSGIDHPLLELTERLQQGVGEAAGAGGARQAVQRRWTRARGARRAPSARRWRPDAARDRSGSVAGTGRRRCRSSR